MCPPGGSDFARSILDPLIPLLRGKYRGPIDINSIVSPDGTPNFLEFTPRFGYSAVFAFSTLVSDFSGLLAATANGLPYRGETKREISCGVRATIPPYPYEVKGEAVGRPIFGWDPEEWNPMVHPCEVRLSERGEAETSGPDGTVFEVTGLGASIPAARAACYAELDALYVPDIRYRTDIGIQAQRDYESLQELGLLSGDERGKDELFG